jgi:molybdopterin-containing oxidoreductase family iron-sulfur binding subunit
MKAGSVHTLIMSGVNPVYTLVSQLLLKGLKVTTSVSLFLKNMKQLFSTIAAPVPHYLEAWDDLSLTKGTYSLTSAYNCPLFDTKQFQDV